MPLTPSHMFQTSCQRLPAASAGTSAWIPPMRSTVWPCERIAASTRVDGFDDVELARLLVGEPRFEVVVAQIVGEADEHQATSNQGSMP